MLGLLFGDDSRNSFPQKYEIAGSIPNLAESITGAVIILQTPYKKQILESVGPG